MCEPCWEGERVVLQIMEEVISSRVGDMDVADVHRARELCLERMPHLDPDKVPLKSTTCIEALNIACRWFSWVARTEASW